MEELVSLLADKATSNLSGQVEALSKAQREHAAATAGVQASLAELEGKLEEVKEVNKVLIDQKNRLITSLCMKECERDETVLRVSHLQKELKEAIDEDVSLTSQLKMKEIEIETSAKTLKEYVQKMDKCKASVETFDKRLPEVVELDQAKERLETLKGERADLERKLNLLSGSRGDCWGDVTDGVRKEIQELESSLKMRNVALEKVRCQLNERQLERMKLETGNTILKNRNSALLIRLKRQLEQQKAKFDQLTNHIEKTENRLWTSKTRLEKLNEQ